MKAGRNRPLEIWFILLCAGFAAFAAPIGIYLLTPEKVRNAAELGLAVGMGLVALIAFFLVLIANVFVFFWPGSRKRNLDQKLNSYALTTFISAALVIGTMLAWSRM